MFLYPKSMVDEKVHTESLKEFAYNNLVDALDVWVWRGKERSREEISILRDCGKVINYNIGDRFGEDVSLPSSKNKADRDRAYDIIMREIEYGLESGAKKIVFASGPDDKDDHEGALERYCGFVTDVLSKAPKDILFSLEPTDFDIDKCFLLGKMDETVSFIKRINDDGYKNLGLLIDMCHVPIMYETLESAVEKGQDVVNHIHLGNGFVSDKASPYYGDKHAPWSIEGGTYTEEDGKRFLYMLKKIGYLDKENATVSFEMRAYEGMTAFESMEKFVSVYKDAINEMH